MKKIFIYKIKCETNNKVYIGQSTNPKRRFNQHLNYNKFIKDDVDKYGKDSFTLEILEECDENNCCDRETYYIEKYDTVNNGYNVQKIAHNGVFNRRRHQWNTGLTKETDVRVKKISDALKGKYCGENSPLYGVPKSKEHRKKMSAIRRTETGEKNHFYGHTHSEDTKKIISYKKSLYAKQNPYIWMTNEIVTKQVKLCDIEEYEQRGFKRGKIRKKEIIIL